VVLRPRCASDTTPKMLVLLVGAVLAFGDARDPYAASFDVPVQEEARQEAGGAPDDDVAGQGGAG
jgi:hypothetical protein